MPTGVLVLAAVDVADRSGPYYLVGGMVGLCVASVLLAGILPRLGRDGANGDGHDEPVGLRALGYFLPIAVAALVAMLLGSTDVAVGIVFGTSVGALTSVVGLTALAEPVGAGPRRWMRLWPFALAASLIVFIAGFKGTFQWADAVALLTQGAVIVGLWFDPGEGGARARVGVTRELFEEALAESSTLDYARGPVGEFKRIDWEGWGLAACELVLVGGLMW